MSNTYGATEAVSWVQSNWIANCCSIASACLIFYDHVTTLGREIDLMWDRRLSSVTLLFHLNRWTTLMWAIVVLLESNLSNPEYESLLLQRLTTCASVGIFNSALSLALFSFWAAFSGIRMYAISGGSWSLAFVTSLLSMVPVGTNAYYYFVTTIYAISSIPDLGQWCTASSDVTEDAFAKFTIATRLCLITADVLILVVTWRKTYITKREADRYGIETPLATMLLRDGTLYFVILLCLNVLNIVGNSTNIFTHASAFTTPISSIIISQFLLNLRQLAYAPHNDGLNSRPSFVLSQHGSPNGSRPASLRFASFVDNMGEDLDRGFGDADRDLDWHILEGNGNAEIGSSSQAEAERVQDSTSASGLHGTRFKDAGAVEKAIVIDMQGVFEQNTAQLEDANCVVAMGFEMDEHKPKGVDVV